jgi:hypothetical protein
MWSGHGNSLNENGFPQWYIFIETEDEGKEGMIGHGKIKRRWSFGIYVNEDYIKSEEWITLRSPRACILAIQCTALFDDSYRSSGTRPVCFAIRANIFGPISSRS